MKNLIAFGRRHLWAFKLAFYAVILIAVVLAIRSEIAGLKLASFDALLARTTPAALLFVTFLSLVAFSAACSYDLAISKYFNVRATNLEIFKIGWITQAFNNFVGLGGMTGGVFRAKFYAGAGVSPEDSVRISLNVWLSNLLGLCFLILAALPEAIGIKESKALILPLLIALYLPIYFLAEKIKLGSFDGKKTPLAAIPLKQKGALLIASVIDWTFAASLFTYIIHLYQPEIPLLLSLFVYATATSIGILSFIPAGLGSFDVSCVILFALAGYSREGVLLSLLVFRVAYYLIPWVIAVVLLVVPWLSGLWRHISEGRKENLITWLLSAGTFFCGVILIASVLTPGVFERVHLLAKLLPPSFIFVSETTTFFIGSMLIILSFGIRSRVRRLYLFCLGLLLAGAFGCILKGLDYEEAVVLLVFALLLLAGRDTFTRTSIPVTFRTVMPAMLLSLSVPVLFLLFEQMAGRGAVESGHWPIQPAHLAFYGCFTLAISLTVLFSRSRKVDFCPLSGTDVERFADFTAQWPGTSYTHLFYLGDKNAFYNQAGDVLIQYRPSGDHILVLGDPIGNREHFAEAIDELVAWADGYDMDVSFYEIVGQNLELYADLGFSFVKIGEEATIRLRDFSMIGSRFKNLRYMVSALEKNQLHFHLVEPPFSEEQLCGWREISDAWLAGRAEMGYSLGFFDAAYLSRAPVAEIRSAGRAEAFVSLMPTPGVPEMSIDLMRVRPDAPPGTMDGLFVKLIMWAREQDYDWFNLGMTPMANVGNQAYSHGVQKLMSYVYDYGNKIYSFKGLRAYKEKFRPEWRSKYIVYKNNRVLPGVLLALYVTSRKPSGEAPAAMAPSNQSPPGNGVSGAAPWNRLSQGDAVRGEPPKTEPLQEEASANSGEGGNDG